MKVAFTSSGGTWAEGILKQVISEQDAPFPQITIEMSVTGGGDPVTVTLSELDLATIGRLARGSTVPRIREAIRRPE
jgi:hypothetical protein